MLAVPVIKPACAPFEGCHGDGWWFDPRRPRVDRYCTCAVGAVLRLRDDVAFRDGAVRADARLQALLQARGI